MLAETHNESLVRRFFETSSSGGLEALRPLLRLRESMDSAYILERLS